MVAVMHARAALHEEGVAVVGFVVPWWVGRSYSCFAIGDRELCVKRIYLGCLPYDALVVNELFRSYRATQSDTRHL